MQRYQISNKELSRVYIICSIIGLRDQDYNNIIIGGMQLIVIITIKELYNNRS